MSSIPEAKDLKTLPRLELLELAVAHGVEDRSRDSSAIIRDLLAKRLGGLMSKRSRTPKVPFTPSKMQDKEEVPTSIKKRKTEINEIKMAAPTDQLTKPEPLPCPSCAVLNKASAKLCGACRAPMASKKATCVCPDCGEDQSGELEFCDQCGADLSPFEAKTEREDIEDAHGGKPQVAAPKGNKWSRVYPSVAILVMEGKYVELSLLLPSAIDDAQVSTVLASGVSIVVKDTTAKRRVTSWGLWAKAMWILVDLALEVGLVAQANNWRDYADMMLEHEASKFDLIMAYDAMLRQTRVRQGRWDFCTWDQRIYNICQVACESVGSGPILSSNASRVMTPVAKKRAHCFAYNSGEGCKTQECAYRHLCTTCNAPHPVQECRVKKAKVRPG
jgi:hypothetical protein